MSQEMMVTCPVCLKENRLRPRSTQGTYKCGHCKYPLPNPFVTVSKQQGSSKESFSLMRQLSNRILLISAALVALSLPLLVRGCSSDRQLSSPSSVSVASPSPTVSSTLPSSTPSWMPSPKPKPAQRPTDDHGSPFPSKSGYLKGYPVLAIGGYSSVTVDNSKNSSDVFVKLFSLNTIPPKAISVFFIRAHDTFTVKDIKPGNYDVRYRDLASGELSRTESFDLKEVSTASGVKFSRLSLTLYKVLDGNMTTQPISEDEF